MQAVTIVIPNYNGKALLENCIKTLEKQTRKDFKVLVIDNGSMDGSVLLSSDILDMEMVALAENTGFCRAVNIGIEKTETEFVILLNNDTEAEPEFVAELLRGIETDETIFSCGAQMIDYRNHSILDNAGDLYTAFGWALARGKGKSLQKYSEECNVFSCCAGAAIYRVDALRKVGYLDECHFAYLEDVDLGYRGRIHGYKNRYLPKARVYHVGSATTGTRYNEKKVFLAARNTIYVIYKNMPMLQLVINMPFILLGIIVKTLFFTKKGFVKEYLYGICDGLKECRKCKKVVFRWKNLKHYFRIQIELWVNIMRILLAK